MKAVRIILLIVLALFTCLVGCTQDNVIQPEPVDNTGTLSLRISSEVAKGIQAIPMETSSYNITITDAAGSPVFGKTSTTETSYSVSLAAGTYRVVVEALNSEGTVIGRNTDDQAVVEAGKTTSFNVIVKELEGDGTFSISIEANGGYSLRYSIAKASGSEVKSGILEYEDGIYSASMTLAKGFYTFTITRDDKETPIKTDTLRIIKDQSVTYSAGFRFLSDGTLVIVDEILKTPRITVTLNKDVLFKLETLTAEAVIEDIQGTSFYWAVDGEKYDVTDVYEALSLPLSSLDAGEHEVALFVSDGTRIWSEAALFTVEEGYGIVGVPSGIDFSADDVYVGLGNPIEEQYFSLEECNKAGYDYAYLIRYPIQIREWYQLEFGRENPYSGNPFWQYIKTYYGISGKPTDERAREFLVDHMSKDSSLVVPENTGAARDWQYPYLTADYSEINEDGELTGFMIDDTGYQVETYPDKDGNAITDPDRIYINVVTDGTDYRYYFVFPNEILETYREMFGAGEGTAFEQAAAKWYVETCYGLDLFNTSLSEIKNVLVANGYVRPVAITIQPRYYSYNPETGSSYSGGDTYSREFRRYVVDDDFQIFCYPHEIYMTYILGGGTGNGSPDYAYREAFYWYLKTYLNTTKQDLYAMIADGTIDTWLAEITENHPEASSDDVLDCSLTTVSPYIPFIYSDSDELILRDVFFYKSEKNFLKLADGSEVSDERSYIVTEDWGSRQVCWIFLPYSYLEIYEADHPAWDGSHHIFRDYLVYKGILSESEKDDYNYTFTVSLLRGVFDSMEYGIRIAMITDYGDITDESFNQATYRACRDYAAAQGLAFQYFKPTGDSTVERVKMIVAAIEAGYNVVVMPGWAFGEAIQETAPTYPNVKFIALDVSEGDLGGSVPANVYAAIYQEEIAGYCAGYAAVKLGYTKLGYLGGIAVPAIIRYGYGFVQGADAAAEETGTAVQLRYAYANQFFGDADITAAMDTWYNAGTECVFACGGGVYTSVAEAAAKVGGKVIGVDVDQAPIIDGAYGKGITVTSAMKGLYASTQAALKTIVEDKNWGSLAGKSANLGLVSKDPELNYVGIPTGAGTQFSAQFTLDDYKALVADLLSGAVKVDNAIDVSPANMAKDITVIDLGRIKEW